MRCEDCAFWKKDYGIWAHNRWTRALSDKGFCVHGGGKVDRSGKDKTCMFLTPVPEVPLVFYSPQRLQPVTPDGRD